MKLTFKKFLEQKSISEADFAEKSVEEVAKLQSEYIEEVAKEIAKETASKEDLKELETELKNLNVPEEFKGIQSLQKSLDEALEDIAQLKEKGNSSQAPTSLRESIKNALIEQKSAIQEMKTQSGAKAQITIKAVAAMTFATHTTGNVGRTEREAGFQSALTRTPILLDLVNTSGTNARHYEWIEKSGKEGGVTMVAEGAVKPQGDWDLSLKTQNPKKEAIIVTISKEMLDDIDGMAKDIEDEIYEQLRLFMDTAIADGDGTGNNIVGFDANATAFTAGAFAGTVHAPNIFDVLRVAVNQVELNNDYPTAILMHPTDATAMDLVKNDNGNYVLPPFTTAGGATIKGLPVKTSTVVTQGEAYVGNFKRYKAKIREDITFEMGYRGNAGDWEKNMVSFLGEARFFGFIPAVHYGSIVKIDLDVAKGLLEIQAAG